VYEITLATAALNFANNAAIGGTNAIKYGKGIGSASVSLNGGTGIIAFNSTVSAQDVYWQADGNRNLIN